MAVHHGGTDIVLIHGSIDPQRIGAAVFEIGPYSLPDCRGQCFHSHDPEHRIASVERPLWTAEHVDPPDVHE